MVINHLLTGMILQAARWFWMSRDDPPTWPPLGHPNSDNNKAAAPAACAAARTVEVETWTSARSEPWRFWKLGGFARDDYLRHL